MMPPSHNGGGSSGPADEIPHVELHPKRDSVTRNIVVSSVELAERERETNLLRKELKRLKAQCTDAMRTGEAAAREVKTLKAKLSSGGVAASFAHLDEKYQRLLRRHKDEVQLGREAVAALKEREALVADLDAALTLRAEDFAANRDELLDAAAAQRRIAAAEARAEELEAARAAAEEAAGVLEEKLAGAEGDAAGLGALLDARQEKLSTLAAEYASLGQAKDELLDAFERSASENDALRAAAAAAKAAEAEVRRLTLRDEVSARRLAQGQARVAELEARCEEERRRTDPAAAEEARVRLADALARAECVEREGRAAAEELEEERARARAALQGCAAMEAETAVLKERLGEREREAEALRADAAAAAALRVEVESLRAAAARVPALEAECGALRGAHAAARAEAEALGARLRAKSAEAERLDILSSTREQLRASAASATPRPAGGVGGAPGSSEQRQQRRKSQKRAREESAGAESGASSDPALVALAYTLATTPPPAFGALPCPATSVVSAASVSPASRSPSHYGGDGGVGFGTTHNNGSNSNNNSVLQASFTMSEATLTPTMLKMQLKDLAAAH